jgi:hypothetical protein
MKPIAWYDPSNGIVSTDQDCPLFTPLGQVWPLYPERTWVGLTNEEMRSLLHLATYMDVTDYIHMLMMAEEKLKEKNHEQI